MAASREGSSGPILLGTAVETMNPPVGLPLAGYPTSRPNTGVAMDLCARAAVFGSVETRAASAALLVLDISGVGAELVATIRERAAAAVPGLPPEALMVAATHTHSAGRLRRRRKESEEETAAEAEYVQTVTESAVGAVAAAWESRAEVRARAGRTEARLAHNRRVVDAEGKATNDWKDPEARHTGYFNPAVRFVAFDKADTGEVCAIIVSYGCHPVVLGPSSTKVSSDYAGYLVRALEAQTGAQTAIHVTGAAGNINPRECLFGEPERAEPMGAAIAAEVVAELPYARPFAASPVLAVIEPLKLVLGPNARDGHIERAQEGPEGRYVLSEVQVLRLGELALVSTPGELLAEIGTSIENVSPFRCTVVVSCANDSLGYLSTDAAQREGGHEARRPVSHDIERPLIAAARDALTKAATAAVGD